MTKNKIKFHFHFFILFLPRLETALWYQNVLIYFCYYSGSFGNTYSKSIDENVWPTGRGERGEGRGLIPSSCMAYSLTSYPHRASSVCVFVPAMSLCGCNKVILVCLTMNKSKITITTTTAATTTQRPQLPLPLPHMARSWPGHKQTQKPKRSNQKPNRNSNNKK